jgi:thioredoxin 1
LRSRITAAVGDIITERQRWPRYNDNQIYNQEMINMANNNVLTITSENFEAEVLNSDKPVLLDFWATWCGPCRMVAPAIDALAEEMADKIKVGKVNVDEQKELAAAFRVMSIPMIAMTRGNQVIMQSVGAKSKDSLKREIEAKLGA